MKKKGPQFLISFIGVFIVILIILYFTIEPSIYWRSLSGEIVMNNSIDNTHTSGVTLYSPQKGKFRLLFKDACYNAVFNSDKSKVFAIEATYLNKENQYALFEYSFKENILTPIIECKGTNTSNYGTVKDVPNSESISYIWQDELYMYNLKTKAEKMLTKIDNNENYSWSNDGSYLLFNLEDSSKLTKYTLDNKKVETLSEGKSPELSHNNKYMAYKSDTEKLIIRDMVTGKEWRYSPGVFIAYYRFSPDDKYVAIAQNEKSSLMSTPAKRIIIWDFKNDKKTWLIKELYYGSEFDWK